MVDKNFTESQNPQHKNNVKHNYNTHSSLQVTQSQNAKKKQTQNPPHKHKTRKRTAENTIHCTTQITNTKRTGLTQSLNSLLFCCFSFVFCFRLLFLLFLGCRRASPLTTPVRDQVCCPAPLCTTLPSVGQVMLGCHVLFAVKTFVLFVRFHSRC